MLALRHEICELIAEEVLNWLQRKSSTSVTVSFGDGELMA